MIREADPMAGQPRRARLAKVFKTKPYNPSKPKTAIISAPELGFNFKTKITFTKLKIKLKNGSKKWEKIINEEVNKLL